MLHEQVHEEGELMTEQRMARVMPEMAKTVADVTERILGDVTGYSLDGLRSLRWLLRKDLRDEVPKREGLDPFEWEIALGVTSMLIAAMERAEKGGKP